MGYPTDQDFEEARRHRTPPAQRDTVRAIAAEVKQRYPDLRQRLQEDYIEGRDDFMRELVKFIRTFD